MNFDELQYLYNFFSSKIYFEIETIKAACKI